MSVELCLKKGLTRNAVKFSHAFKNFKGLASLEVDGHLALILFWPRSA